MDLFEYENQQFPGTWTDETIKELREYEPPKCTGTPLNEEPDCFYCWRGTRIPKWFE